MLKPAFLFPTHYSLVLSVSQILAAYLRIVSFNYKLHPTSKSRVAGTWAFHSNLSALIKQTFPFVLARYNS